MLGAVVPCAEQRNPISMVSSIKETGLRRSLNIGSHLGEPCKISRCLA